MKVLKGIREGYKGKVERVFRLSKDQQDVFQAGLQNYCNFGGHGSGNRIKTQFPSYPQAKHCLRRLA